ncbi:MAG TPA: FxDxF family PEP-CTERM protein [Roseateles sp.]
MKLKNILCAVALAVVGAGAYAEDITQSFALTPNTSWAGAFSGGWGVTHTSSGAFTDTFTFTGASAGSVDGSLITIGFSDRTDIDFTSVSINGHAYTLNSTGPVGTATLSPVELNGPLVLTVTGIAGPALSAGTSIAASYAGTLNVSPVPEPQTLALMLAGLGVVGVLKRRRMPR